MPHQPRGTQEPLECPTDNLLGLVNGDRSVNLGPSRICSISSETTRFELEGITGEADYGPLPTWLLPWLQTTGHLHTGPHRIAGAGGWTVQVWK